MKKFKVTVKEKHLFFNDVLTNLDIVGDEERGYFFTNRAMRVYPLDRTLPKSEVESVLGLLQDSLNEVSLDKML